MRRWLFSLLLLFGCLALLSWAARININFPFFPTNTLSRDGANFHVVMGAGALDNNALKISVMGSESNALQSIELQHIQARDFPILRYRFEDFPHLLELSLIFRTADAPDDVQVIALPWPGRKVTTFDLSSLPNWNGEIIELGFAEFPTGQWVPPNYHFSPFTFYGAYLWSPSWQGSLAAIVTDWFGYWPWSQRSVHALGRDTDTPRGRPFNLVLAALIVLILVGGKVVLRWSFQELMRTGIILLVLSWLTLDARWQLSLRAKHQSTRELYANKSWEERKQLVADAAICDAAEKVRQLLRQEGETTRVLLHAGSTYESLRFYYHLLPINVGLLSLAVANEQVSLPAGAILIFYDDDNWSYDAKLQALRASGSLFPVTELMEIGLLRVYRLRNKT